MNVLIVDDDAADSEIFCEAIRNVVPGVTCLASKSGADAIKLLRSQEFKPNYIFLDIYMHLMDGKECLLRIKNIKDVIRVPVIIYTSAVLTEQEKSVYKKLGAHTFIPKPNSFSELQESLQDIVRAPRTMS